MSARVVIVGAGPAGVSAALWARSLELEPLLVDAGSSPGGQLHSVHFHPHELPGFEQGDGPVLAAAYARQLAEAQVVPRAGVRAAALEPASPGRGPAVVLEGGERVAGDAVLVASGVRRRRLGVPGEAELDGRGISWSATRDRARLAGRRVVVVGGGDGAFENALVLAAAGCEVTLVVRGAPRARAGFRERVAASPGVRVLEGTRVLAVLGDACVRGVRVGGPGGEAELPADALVIKVGVEPNSEWCRAAVAVDAEGYVQVDARLATSAPGVWAAGDITRPWPPSIPVALGQGAQAMAHVRAALGRG